MRMNWIALLLGWLTFYVDDPDAGGAADGDKGAAAGGDAGAAGDKDGAAADAGAAAGDKGAAGDGDKDPWGGLRERYSGDDPKKLAKISRYQTPEAALDALLGLQDRVRSGELKSALPKDATPESMTKWREENGIPASFDKYEIVAPKGVEITAEDKPYIDKLLQGVHAQHGNAAMANTVVDLYYKVQEDMTQARAVKDREYVQQQEDSLRATWGKEYRLNMNSVSSLLATMPADVKTLFERGRLADGNPMLGNAKVAMWLTGISREINPVTALPPLAGSDVSGSIETQIAQIEGWMKSPRDSANGKKYWADEKVQEHYRGLLDAQTRGKAREQ